MNDFKEYLKLDFKVAEAFLFIIFPVVNFNSKLPIKENTCEVFLGTFETNAHIQI